VTELRKLPQFLGDFAAQEIELSVRELSACVALVSHRSATKIASTQTELVASLRARFGRSRILHIPVLVNLDEHLGRESTRRTLPPDADPQQLAMLAINPPTAALLLSEYVTLKPGEWVVQNAANSGVGRWVIAFAKTRSLKTVNIVRRPASANVRRDTVAFVMYAFLHGCGIKENSPTYYQVLMIMTGRPSLWSRWT